MAVLSGVNITPIFMRGGINTRLRHYEDFPTRPLDLFNVLPDLDGYTSAPGWAIQGAEIASSNGSVNHLAAFGTTVETSFIIAVTTKKFYELSSGTWTSRQDANNFTMNATDHVHTSFYNDIFYVGIPASASANALSQWTGSGNISRVAGSPRNARWVEWFGNYLVTGGTWGGSTYNATRIYRSAQGDPVTHPGDYTDLVATPYPVMNMYTIGQMLVCYKQYGVSVLHITGDDLLPFEPDQIPNRAGLAMSEAIGVGGDYHVYMSDNNFYKFDGLSAPEPIGIEIVSLVHENLAAGSAVIGGYDVFSPQREAFYFLTNVALAADAVGPNSAAATNGYWVWHVPTKSWARGDVGANAPHAFGKYYSRYGFLDEAPISRLVSNIALDSSGGTSVFAFDHTLATRAGATVTRRILSTIAHMGDPFTQKTAIEAIPIIKQQSSGTLTLSWKIANQMGAKPSERRSVSFDMTGATSPAVIPLNCTGYYHQFEITSTALFDYYGLMLRWKGKH